MITVSLNIFLQLGGQATPLFPRLLLGKDRHNMEGIQIYHKHLYVGPSSQKQSLGKLLNRVSRNFFWKEEEDFKRNVCAFCHESDYLKYTYIFHEFIFFLFSSYLKKLHILFMWCVGAPTCGFSHVFCYVYYHVCMCVQIMTQPDYI